MKPKCIKWIGDKCIEWSYDDKKGIVVDTSKCSLEKIREINKFKENLATKGIEFVHKKIVE